MTGTCILQTNRATFNQNRVGPVCLFCHQENETGEHFLLHCPASASHEDPIIDTLFSLCTGVQYESHDRAAPAAPDRPRQKANSP